MPTVPQDRRPPVDVAGAAKYIGCPERYVRRLVFERRIPFLKVGGTKIRFLPADLDAWLAAQHVEALR